MKKNIILMFIFTIFMTQIAQAGLWHIATGIYSGIVYVPQSLWVLFSSYWWQKPVVKPRFINDPATPEMLEQLFGHMHQSLEIALTALPATSSTHLYYACAQLYLAQQLTIQNVPHAVAQCEKIRETIMLLMRRTDPAFMEGVDQTTKINLEHCGLTPEHVYRRLGFDEHAQQKVTVREINRSITARLKAANTNAEKYQLRQVGFLFRNALAKEEFDAYLAGAQKLETLLLTPEMLEPLTTAFTRVSQYKDALERTHSASLAGRI